MRYEGSQVFISRCVPGIDASVRCEDSQQPSMSREVSPMEPAGMKVVRCLSAAVRVDREP